MTTPPDLEALARRYVDLWQDQVAAAAADPEIGAALARLTGVFGGGLAASAAFWRTLWSGFAAAGGGEWHGESDAASGAAPAAGASAGGGVDLAQLQARLAALEERLDAVDGRPRRPRGRPRQRSRRDPAP